MCERRGPFRVGSKRDISKWSPLGGRQRGVSKHFFLSNITLLAPGSCSSALCVCHMTFGLLFSFCIFLGPAGSPIPGAAPVPPGPAPRLGLQELARGGDCSITAQQAQSCRIGGLTIAGIEPSFPRAHVTLRLSRGRRSPDRGLTWAQPAGRELAGGPWQAAGSGFRCCWRRRWLARPRRCGPGPSTSKPTTGATRCTPTTSSSGTTPVRPRRRVASSSTRPFDATETCSSVPALGPDPTSQVSHSPFFRPKERPSVDQPRPGCQTFSPWLLPQPSQSPPTPPVPLLFL